MNHRDTEQDATGIITNVGERRFYLLILLQ